MKGFTLIEIMIVAAILGILLAMGMPAYQDYKKQQSSPVVIVQPKNNGSVPPSTQ